MGVPSKQDVGTNSDGLVGVVAIKLHACWEVLVRTGFEPYCNGISVAVPVAYIMSLTGLPED